MTDGIVVLGGCGEKIHLGPLQATFKVTAEKHDALRPLRPRPPHELRHCRLES
ncbi:hypothetical protein AB0M48_30265 [Lentzea sp. NPDC051208]|uniref:hypothetical protein n=1 Tax=Lentzea sp. NPDC051208 TaxID=3154642 RepID=UPI00342C8F80